MSKQIDNLIAAAKAILEATAKDDAIPSELEERLRETIAALAASEREEGRWISIKDRLPLFDDQYGGERVLLYDGEEVYASFLDRSDISDWHITHWMPLPAPPASAQGEAAAAIDDLLLQEVYSLREKLKIAVAAIKADNPSFDDVLFLHQCNSADFDQCMEDLDPAPRDTRALGVKVCPACNGSGKSADADNEPIECEYCKGTGEIIEQAPVPSAPSDYPAELVQMFSQPTDDERSEMAKYPQLSKEYTEIFNRIRARAIERLDRIYSTTALRSRETQPDAVLLRDIEAVLVELHACDDLDCTADNCLHVLPRLRALREHQGEEK